MEAALDVLRAVDFDWTRHIDSVWSKVEHHVPDLNKANRATILEEIGRLPDSCDTASPLGNLLIGPAGSGKTHLLGALRRDLGERGVWFVLVDMTDVNNFWETTCLGYLNSLQRLLPSGELQLQRLLRELITQIPEISNPQERMTAMAEHNNGRMISVFVDKTLLGGLGRSYRGEVQKHRDVLRALFLLNSQNFEINDVGYSWLQGIGIEEEERKLYGFRKSKSEAKAVVEGLSWAMSLVAPTVLAFDQIDAIVAQHHMASSNVDEESSEEARVSYAIMEGIGGGLMSLFDATKRTMTLVSCLEPTLCVLQARIVKSFEARFKTPRRLSPLSRRELAEALVVARLESTYHAQGFNPPYPSWPFRPELFVKAEGLLPRELLKRCDAHRQQCLAQGKVEELSEFSQIQTGTGDNGTTHLDHLYQQFESFKSQADFNKIIDQENEDGLADNLLEAACRCLAKEVTVHNDIDLAIDEDFIAGNKHNTLHVRFRVIYRAQHDMEKHFSFRVLQRTHANAYQSRLKAAITASGIDRGLNFRRLVIIRNADLPGGRVTQQITEKFRSSGGIFVHPSEDEWRTLWALYEMERAADKDFETWLSSRKPVCQLAIMQAAGVCEVLKDLTATEAKISDPISHPQPPIETVISATPDSTEIINIGRRFIGGNAQETVGIATKVLNKHTVVLAGAGSGKTVLVRRIVEEAALAGIPSIVIDPANDLARLGDAWPEAPEHWWPDDADRAKTYFDQSEVCIWTPGKERGNPIKLAPIPDLTTLVDDSDELENAILLAQEALRGIVAPGRGQADQKKAGVLASALRYLAKQPRCEFDDLINMLKDLPIEASGGIGDATRLAAAMADSLLAEKAQNPLLRSEGTTLDPGELIGVGKGKTRVSVVNIAGFPGLIQQQQFVAQLTMTLFTWIKKNPASSDQPIRGLFVIDEAKDFVPSGKQAVSRDPLLRLAAQARKYGLGMVVATQEPRSIDHKIISNCTTHIYGKANSPAAQNVIRDQLEERQGSGRDIATLPPGNFYLYSEGFQAPQRMVTPLCLSHHPPAPLDERGVLERAQKCRLENQ